MSQNNLDQLVAESVQNVLASLMPTIVSNVVTAVSGQAKPDTAQQSVTGSEVTETVTSINGILVNKGNRKRAYNWLRRNLEGGYTLRDSNGESKSAETVINDALDAIGDSKAGVSWERADNSHVQVSERQATNPRNVVKNGNGSDESLITPEQFKAKCEESDSLLLDFSPSTTQDAPIVATFTKSGQTVIKHLEARRYEKAEGVFVVTASGGNSTVPRKGTRKYYAKLASNRMAWDKERQQNEFPNRRFGEDHNGLYPYTKKS